jgi:hypothetical protein
MKRRFLMVEEKWLKAKEVADLARRFGGGWRFTVSGVDAVVRDEPKHASGGAE